MDNLPHGFEPIAAAEREPIAAAEREPTLRLVPSTESDASPYPPVPESTIDALADLIIAHFKKHPDLTP